MAHLCDEDLCDLEDEDDLEEDFDERDDEDERSLSLEDDFFFLVSSSTGAWISSTCKWAGAWISSTCKWGASPLRHHPRNNPRNITRVGRAARIGSATTARERAGST